MQRHDVEMLIVNIVAGPVIASFVIFLALALMRFGVTGLAAVDLSLSLAAIPFAYLLAWPCALAAGVANAVVARFARSDILRLLLSLPIGALSFGIGLAWLLEDDDSLLIQSAVPITGALVSLICVALVDAFGTPVRRRG